MLRLPGNEEFFITFSDQAGKILLVKKLAASGEIDPGLPAGIYFVTIRGKGFVVTKKLIIL